MQPWAKCPFFSGEAAQSSPAMGSRLQLQMSPLCLLGFSFLPPLPPPSPEFPEGGAMGSLPACSRGIALPSPQPPFDPSSRSRMKAHCDRRDMSLPLDNRSRCFPITQLPDGIDRPQALLVTRHTPSAHAHLAAQPQAFTPSAHSDSLLAHTHGLTGMQLFPHRSTGSGLKTPARIICL